MNCNQAVDGMLLTFKIFLLTYPPVHQAELRLFAHHAYGCLRVGHPDGSPLVLAGRLLTALVNQVLDALVYVCHPFLREKEKESD